MVMIQSAVCSTFVLLFCIFSPLVLYAAEPDGSSTIKLQGSMAQGVANRITVKELEALGVSRVEILDPFEKKVNSFTGIMIEKMIAHYGNGDVQNVIFSAIDDYTVSFSPADWTHHTIMVVTRVNDNYLDYEQKGPIRIIYPDYDPEKFNSKEILPKWIWMITTIRFR